MHDRGNVLGLTTAATLWATASVGLATGYGMYMLALLVAMIVFALLSAHDLPGWSRLKVSNGPMAARNEEAKRSRTSDDTEQRR
jgi:putative Mg2+ transporter-C (MgtC) family protein